MIALGVLEAAKKHGVAQSCVSRWAKDAGVRRDVAATPPRAAAARTRKDASPVSEPQVTPTVGPKPAPLVGAERASGMSNETNNPLARRFGPLG